MVRTPASVRWLRLAVVVVVVEPLGLQAAAEVVGEVVPEIVNPVGQAQFPKVMPAAM
jgi:hypothetical protein